MTVQLLELDPTTYQPHPLHAAQRDWTETNCWQDMMIEVLHVLGLDPVAASAFTFGSDFDGEQWTLFKFPPDDLRSLYGLEIEELYVWRPVVDHLEEHLGLGHLVTVEVDAWHLPDTAGVTYQTDHVKTGIVAQMLDRARRRLGYFHNAGYFELCGDDFDGVFHLPGGRAPHVLLPYMEVVKLERIGSPTEPELVERAIALASAHLARRPATNPMARFETRLHADLPALAAGGDAVYHPYAFGTCRQCGANAEVAAAFVDWLEDRAALGIGAASGHLRSISTSAKALQFVLARAARGRNVDVAGPLGEMARSWDAAMGILVEHFGC